MADHSGNGDTDLVGNTPPETLDGSVSHQADQPGASKTETPKTR